MEKTFINYFWKKETDPDMKDVIYSIIMECAPTPDYYVHNLRIDKAELEINDCYLDEKGDLYVPAVYREIRDEVTAEEYILLKTKKDIEAEYINYKANKN